jgi:signal transduction histidine kinase
MNKIRRQLSAKLSIGITLAAAPIFVLALGILFLYSRSIIQQETVKQVTSVLNTATQRVKSTTNLVENAINSNSWLMEEHFRADSLQSICLRIALLNRTVNTCHITTDSVEIAQITLGSAMSITATGDTVFTYSKALRPDGGPIKGVVTATLAFQKLATAISETELPTPHSYFRFIKNDERCEEKGNLVVYNAIAGTEWNLALVCPKHEILKSYNQLLYWASGLLLVGLILILGICYLVTRKTVKPLSQLLVLTKKIVDGHYDDGIPHSKRQDVIGRLQNSFVVMQQSLHESVSSIHQTAEETQKHNKELAQAMTMAEKAVKNKALFIQNVSHQMRTPLNIAMGFADVLGDNLKTQKESKGQHPLRKEELADIIDTMTHNAIHLNRMVQMLADSSEYGTSHELITKKSDIVCCNTIAQECIDYMRERFPKATLFFESELPDKTTFKTNHLFLMRTLRELLFNAAKYSDGQHIKLRVTETITTIRFIVEDIGPGIEKEAQAFLFKPFAKVDDLSEGLGLGLPLAKRHAYGLGGDLLYDESYHDGCRFILEVPK